MKLLPCFFKFKNPLEDKKFKRREITESFRISISTWSSSSLNCCLPLCKNSIVNIQNSSSSHHHHDEDGFSQRKKDARWLKFKLLFIIINLHQNMKNEQNWLLRLNFWSNDSSSSTHNSRREISHRGEWGPIERHRDNVGGWRCEYFLYDPSTIPETSEIFTGIATEAEKKPNEIIEFDVPVGMCENKTIQKVDCGNRRSKLELERLVSFSKHLNEKPMIKWRWKKLRSREVEVKVSLSRSVVVENFWTLARE